METRQLKRHLLELFPEEQVFLDELSRLGKGTDAGLYRLVPKAVVKVNTEEEVIRLLKFCRQEKLPVTFKAAGTSLSGQTVTDSILMETGPGFAFSVIEEKGRVATFGCGVTGGSANRALARHQRKLGPKPASIVSAKIGGIVANNASGSSYGILHNSYNTIRSMRIIFADGSLLDTGDTESRRSFVASHPGLIDDIKQLHKEATENEVIRQTITSKFSLKNTCGYGMNSLVDFNDPVQIIQHLMIGSEGTLGFMPQVTFQTVRDAPLKATAMAYFPNLRAVSDTIVPLRKCMVSAAELMDRNALRAVQDQPGMPEELCALPDGAAALLIDTSADDETTLRRQIEEIEKTLSGLETLYPIRFTTDRILYNRYWKVRDGLFTSAAASRPPQTACIIEDIAFRAESLGDALTDVRELLIHKGYENAVMWGHLLDGNVHFTVFPNINTPEEVDRYAAFMHELSELVAVRHRGSLKAEHGTGRNMAPFVEKEWGSDIYALMKRIKRAFDPANILNPGVIINDDPEVFVKNLKHIPEVNPLVDKCIECGFCEVTCPSKNLTLTPRQRIVAYRHLTTPFVTTGASSRREQSAMRKQLGQISYELDETCATDGLCGLACPVGIDTGKLVKELRWEKNGKLADKMAGAIARHMGGTTAFVRALLPVPHHLAKVTGYVPMESFAAGLYRLGNGLIPLWTRHTPSGSKKLTGHYFPSGNVNAPEVVYFPACITRAMSGPSYGYQDTEDVPHKMLSVLHKAGYAVIIPENRNNLCCGMAFSSKGFRRQAAEKEQELNEALLAATHDGELPVVCDMSPCLLHMRETLDKRLRLYDQVEFIHDFLLDRLKLVRQPVTVAIHTTCSSTKMQLEEKLTTIAARCAEKVMVPENVSCCGWAGDRGFFYPELNNSALAPLRDGIKNATEGYSNSRTCEIGLSINSGITYQSIIYLVDKASR